MKLKKCASHILILNFEQLLKHILVFPSWGGGGGGEGKFNSGGLDHSGSQPFNYSVVLRVSQSARVHPALH